MRLNWEQRAKFEQSGLSLNDWKSVNVWKRKCTHPRKYLTRWSEDDISCGKTANLRLYNSIVAQEMICEACYKKTNPFI